MIWLDNARIIAVFAVVFLHSAAGVVIDSPFGTNNWWFGNIFDSLVRWCVPVFVMLSGALLLDSNKKEDLKTFYLKRLSRILVPILFWSVFFIFWTAFGLAIEGQPVVLVDLTKKILTGKPYYHMWFLYMISILYLFTFFLRKIISRFSRFEILALIFVLFFLSAANSLSELFAVEKTELFIYWFLPYLPYFLLGYFVNTSAANYEKSILMTGFCFSVFLTALGCFFLAKNKGIDAGLYFYDYLSITVIPMSVFVIFLLKLITKPIGNQQLTKKISTLTLGIYLVHPVFIEVIAYFGYGIPEFNPLLSIPITSVVVFGLSLGVTWAISNIPYFRRII